MSKRFVIRSKDVEVMVHDSKVTMSIFGGQEELKHGIAVLNILKEVVR